MTTQALADIDNDAVMPGAAVRQAFGITAMTEYRWRKAGILPQPAKVRGINYYKRKEISEILKSKFGGSDNA